MVSDIANSVIPTHPLEDHAWKSDYTLSESSQVEFRGLLEGLRDALGQHDTKIARVRATLDQLLDERKSYVLRIDKLKSALAPHKKLPPELLSKIFKDCSLSPLKLPPDKIRRIGNERPATTLPPTKPSSINRPRILPSMEVCSRWREIALNSHELWDDVSIKYPVLHSLSDWATKSGNLTEKVHQMISRGTRSIAIFISVNREIVLPEAIDPLRILIIPFSHQLTHINLMCSMHHLFDFLRCSSSPSFPILESLTLKSEKVQSLSEHESFSDLAMFKNTPNLKVLRIHFSLLVSMPLYRLQLPWDQLTKIDLRDTWLDPGIVHLLLSQCTGVVSCWLSLDHIFEDTHVTPFTTIVHPHLQSLSIASAPGEPNITVLFLQSLTLPSLRSFEITDLRSDESLLGLLSLIPRSQCALINFSMPKAQIPASLLDPLLELLPALEDLDISKTIIPIPTLEHIAQGVLLPKLTSIACTIQSSPRSLETFMDAVERTGATESGITRLQVASARFPPTERHYKAVRWPQAIERFKKLAEKLREEGRSITLTEFRGLS